MRLIGVGQNVREVLTRRPWWTFGIVAATVTAVSVVYGRGLWFYNDEWRFNFDRQLTIADLIRP